MGEHDHTPLEFGVPYKHGIPNMTDGGEDIKKWYPTENPWLDIVNVEIKRVTSPVRSLL